MSTDKLGSKSRDKKTTTTRRPDSKKLDTSKSANDKKTTLSAAELQKRNERKRAYLKALLERQGSKKKEVAQRHKKARSEFLKKIVNRGDNKDAMDYLKEIRFNRGDFKPGGEFYDLFFKLAKKELNISDKDLHRALRFIKLRIEKNVPNDVGEESFRAFVRNSIKRFVEHMDNYDGTILSNASADKVSKGLDAFLQKEKAVLNFKNFVRVHPQYAKDRLNYSDMPGMMKELKSNLSKIPSRYGKLGEAIRSLVDQLDQKVAKMDYKDKDNGYKREYERIVSLMEKITRNEKLRGQISSNIKAVGQLSATAKTKIENQFKLIKPAEKIDEISAEGVKLDSLNKEIKTKEIPKLKKSAKKEKELANLNDEEKKVLADPSIIKKKLAIPVFGGLVASWYAAKHGIGKGVLKKIGVKMSDLWAHSFLGWLFKKNRSKTESFGKKIKSMMTRIPFFGKFFEEKGDNRAAIGELKELVKTYGVPKKYFKSLDKNMRLNKLLAQKSAAGFSNFSKFKAVLQRLYVQNKSKLSPNPRLKDLFGKLSEGDVKKAVKALKSKKKTK